MTEKSIIFFDFLASPGAPGGFRTKNSENYFYIFYGIRETGIRETEMPGAWCRMPEHEMPGAGCRVSCYHVVTDFPFYGFF